MGTVMIGNSLLVCAVVLKSILALALACLPSHGVAQTTFDEYSIALNIWRDTPAGPLAPGNVLSYRAGSFEIKQLNLPPGVSIQALARKGDYLFIAPDITFKKGEQTFTPRDVVRVSANGAFELFASSDSLLLNPPSKISAISFVNDDLLIVLDTIVQIDKKVFTPRDVIRYSAGIPQHFFIGQDSGIPESTRIVSVDATETGHLFLSFSSTFSLPDQLIRASDLVYVNLKNGTAVKPAAKRESILGICAECRLAGFSATANEDVIFRTRFIDFWR